MLVPEVKIKKMKINIMKLRKYVHTKERRPQIIDIHTEIDF